jgi:hypothetical protein
VAMRTGPRRVEARLLRLLLVGAVLGIGVTPAAASHEGRFDDVDHALSIGLNGFDPVETHAATAAADDPSCLPVRDGATVWWVYRPDMPLRVVAEAAADYDMVLSVWTGQRGSLHEVGCAFDAVNRRGAELVFDAVPGTAYYFMLGSAAGGDGGQAALNLEPLDETAVWPGGEDTRVPFDAVAEVAPEAALRLRDGAAILNGTVTCSQPGTAPIIGTLRQTTGPAQTIAAFNEMLTCSPEPRAFTLSVVPSQGRFLQGPADLAGALWACDDTRPCQAAALRPDLTLVLRTGEQ